MKMKVSEEVISSIIQICHHQSLLLMCLNKGGMFSHKLNVCIWICIRIL